MKRVLLIGMSGTGKSSVVRELAARGFKAVDTDDGWFEALPDGRQRWREDAIQTLLATEDADVLFVAGCEENQARFHAQFDRIVLLSAPVQTLLDRLVARASNPYGKAPEELNRVLNDIETVEPLLRRVADHEVRTTIPLNEVVTVILRLVDARRAARVRADTCERARPGTSSLCRAPDGNGMFAALRSGQVDGRINDPVAGPHDLAGVHQVLLADEPEADRTADAVGGAVRGGRERVHQSPAPVITGEEQQGADRHRADPASLELRQYGRKRPRRRAQHRAIAPVTAS